MAKKDKFSDMQMPPLWSGVAGQGNQKLYSLGGKWYPTGTTLSSGYKIVGDDGKGSLTLSWNGIPVKIGMQGSTIAPYTPQSGPMFMGADKSAIFGGGALTTAEEKWMNANSYTNDPTQAVSIEGMEPSIAHKTYNVIDRTGIDEFINKMRTEYPHVNFGTLDDYNKASPEQKRKGFQVWNNASGDFTDFFQEQ